MQKFNLINSDKSSTHKDAAVTASNHTPVGAVEINYAACRNEPFAGLRQALINITRRNITLMPIKAEYK